MTTSPDDLRDLIETERVRFDVPGVAVAVVVDGEVVLQEGFGLRDLESRAPVTGRTLFPIASDTKCFTAATLCLLADEGRLDLDAPVREVVPWFAMHDPLATALVSTRDLLSHRSGLPRHDFVWYGETDHTLESIVRSLVHLPLSKQPRQAWQYNNLAYSTAGYVTEQVAGESWSEVVRQQLLEPLGMKATGFCAQDAADGDYAFPYNKVDDKHVLQVLPPRSKLGPPGGMVSNVEDLSRWVLARLGREVDGNRVLSDSALAQLHGPAMIGGVGGGAFAERQPMGYALGCQVESYRGHRVVRHGGNLVGYSSDVCVAPDLGAAVVVLTNLHGTALRDALALMVLDRVLGLDPVPWGERYHAIMSATLQGRADVGKHRAAAAPGRPATRPLEEFAGDYTHPAYGTLSVTVTADGLDADFHALGDRLGLQHRDRDVWDLELREFDQRLPVVFLTGADGEVTGLTVPFEVLCEPIPFTKAAEPVTPGLLDVVAGAYELGPLTVTVQVTDGTVSATLPQFGRVPLTPAGGSVFRSPDVSLLRATFEQSADGQVTRLVLEPLGIFTPKP